MYVNEQPSPLTQIIIDLSHFFSSASTYPQSSLQTAKLVKVSTIHDPQSFDPITFFSTCLPSSGLMFYSLQCEVSADSINYHFTGILLVFLLAALKKILL